MKDVKQLDDCFGLMETLIGCRRGSIHGQLDQVRKNQSMLHLDVLLLVYHFARTCEGHVLEIGSFLGGSTTAAAWGIRESGSAKKLITIEPGGRVDNHRLATRNILRDLKRNLAKQRVADRVTLMEGRSSDEAIIEAVHNQLGRDQVGLLVLDADGQVKRDIEAYCDLLADGCQVVIDDYTGPVGENEKVLPTRTETNELIAAGKLVPLGYYGWGTWIGRWRM